MKKPPPPPIAPVRGRLFRVRAAAQYLGLGEWQVRLLLARGDLVALRSSGGRLMGIYETDCDAWMATHRSRRLDLLDPGGMATASANAAESNGTSR